MIRRLAWFRSGELSNSRFAPMNSTLPVIFGIHSDGYVYRIHRSVASTSMTSILRSIPIHAW